MEIINQIKEIQQISYNFKSQGKKIIVVPTMGYLHKGHISLIIKAKEIADIVICTLFVNPKQFGPNEDFERYPRDEARDISLLEEIGCDYLFLPSAEEMYPTDFDTSISLGGITKILEGTTRPTHYDGVALVVLKLFNITLADYAILGQKDYQQFMVISKLVDDLNLNIKLIMAPIVREENGLAMSSRNRYLSEEEFNQASVINKSLQEVSKIIQSGELFRNNINKYVSEILKSSPLLKIDYVETILDKTFELKEQFKRGNKIVVLIACWVGKTRLIDNIIIDIE